MVEAEVRRRVAEAVAAGTEGAPPPVCSLNTDHKASYLSYMLG